MPLIVLVWVVRRSFQIILAEASVGGGFFQRPVKARIASYDGFEIPVPLSITIQFGEGDIVQVAKDILGLTKLNYNSCQLGEGRPITIKYSDRVGEIILANPGLPQTSWKHNFKYYA